MSIDSISVTTASLFNYSTGDVSKDSTGTASASGTAEGVLADTSTQQDTYVSTGSKNKVDAETINRMKADLEAQKLRFLKTVQSSLTKQITFGQGAWKNLSGTQSSAQAAISEDGYWGVEQTSQRLVSFAMALVGGDPSKAEEMREAFIKGYEAAEEAFGGTLPEISRKTYDATMKLFDEWASGTDEEAASTTGKISEAGTNETNKANEANDANEAQGGSVTFNEAKRARMLAAAKTTDDIQTLMSLLSEDLSDCKAGVSKGWCDDSEVAKVEAMIRRAQSRMAQLAGDNGNEQEDQAASNGFMLNMLM